MDNPRDPASGKAALPRRVFRVPAGRRYLSLFGAAFLGVVMAIMIVLAALVVRAQWIAGLVVAACAGVTGALTLYVWRDLKAKWRLRIVLDANAATLDLPAGRSLIHSPPPQSLTIPYADIDSIESRFEAYRSLGQTMMQRAYVLRTKRGELIFLFEDRALATKMESADFAGIVMELAARANVGVHDLGVVEGEGGLLGVWGTHAPDWAAAPLARDRAARLWRDAAATGSLAISLALFIAICLRFFNKP